MSTSPAPNAGAAMDPFVAAKGGGGGAGGGDANGNGGGDGAGGNGDGGNAPEGAPDTASASDPVDVVAGRVFTLPVPDLQLHGPLPLEFIRRYSSSAVNRDFGLGWGWAHSWGWEIEVRRRRLTLWTEEGINIDFGEPLSPGGERIGPWGYLLRREARGFVLDVGDGLRRVFGHSLDGGTRHRLTAIEDGNRNAVRLEHDGNRLSGVVDAVGRAVRVTSTPEGRILALSVRSATSAGQPLDLARYSYDGDGNLVRVTDAEGNEFTYAYMGQGLLTQSRDRVGLVFSYVYDAARRCREVWGEYPDRVDPCLADGVPELLRDGTTRAKGIYHCVIEYGPNGYREVIDSTTVRRFWGNARGTIDKSVSGYGVISRKYDERGYLVARVDGTGAVTRFERDPRGRILAITDPLGRRTQIERDAEGNPVQVTHPNGATTRLRHDERGNVIAVSDEIGAATFYRHDSRGLLTAVESDGGSWQIFRDAHGNQVAAVALDGARWTWEYDWAGRMTARTDPLGVTVRYEYSLMGALLARHAPEGTTRYSYDAEGYLVRIENPLGGVRSFEWGGYRQLCSVTNENGHVVRLKYDRDGEVVEVHNERGEVHRLEYDASRRLVKELTFDGRAYRYRFDRAGRVRSIEDSAGRRRDFEFDAAGNIVAIEWPDGSRDVFEYDTRNAVIAVTGAAGRFRFERDLLGRIVREEQSFGGSVVSVETTWGASGEVIARGTSTGHVESIHRDARGLRRQTTANGLVMEHENDPLGRELHRLLSPTGGAIHTTYTHAGQIESRYVTSPLRAARSNPGEPAWIGERPDVVWGRSYRYDARQELTGAWDRDSGWTLYNYDASGQILAARRADGHEERFRYDPAGNLDNLSQPSGAWVHGPGGRLLRAGSSEYRWDALGRLVERRVQGEDGQGVVSRYEWNDRDLLVRATTADGLVVRFAYDPLARRIQKVVSRKDEAGNDQEIVATRYVWDKHRVICEMTRTRAGDRVRTYLYEDDAFVPLAHHEGGSEEGWICYVTDPAGTPDALALSDGTLAGVLDRSIWGRTTTRPGSRDSTPLRFQGQYEDWETGLFYNRFRYYDPETARYVSPDPTGLLGGLHSYRYVPNPFRWVDPFGLVVINAGEREFPFPDNPDEFILRGHGNSTGIHRPLSETARSDTKTYMLRDEKELADYIRNHPDYKPGMTVRLAGCKTAQGPNSITDRLAKEMAKDGSKVYGTTENLHIKEGGTHTIFTENERNEWQYAPGYWRQGGEAGPAAGPPGYRPSTREQDSKFSK